MVILPGRRSASPEHRRGGARSGATGIRRHLYTFCGRGPCASKPFIVFAVRGIFASSSGAAGKEGARPESRCKRPLFLIPPVGDIDPPGEPHLALFLGVFDELAKRVKAAGLADQA